MLNLMASWWNGRHKGLKILALLGVPVQVRPRLPIEIKFKKYKYLIKYNISCFHL